MPPINVPALRVVFDEDTRKRILSGIDDCLSRGSVAAGKKVQEFEEFWSAYTGCSCAVATSSGGSALEVLMRVLKVQGKEVIVPTNTFIATATAVINAGGRPVLADCDHDTLTLSLSEIKKRCTDKTLGVIIVHIGGVISSEIVAIEDWCRRRGLWLVEDAAHAHGSEFDGKRAGAFGIAAAYSFFATKVITSGEGGMIVCRDEKLAEACRQYRDYGKKSQWESVHTVISGNNRMSDVSAVVGLEHARRLDAFITERESISARYRQQLRDVLKFVLPKGRSSWYKCIAYLPKHIDRTAFKKSLKDMGVSLAGGVYDLPLHAQPVFEGMFEKSDFPVASEICERHVCLPIFAGMRDDEVLHVIESVRMIVGT